MLMCTYILYKFDFIGIACRLTVRKLRNVNHDTAPGYLLRRRSQYITNQNTLLQILVFLTKTQKEVVRPPEEQLLIKLRGLWTSYLPLTNPRRQLTASL